jgi:corrinoid protein of di/trimethylamine methyltransferase
MDQAHILHSLQEAVIEMDEDGARELAEAALAHGLDAYDTIMNGLAPGMAIVSQKYDEEEYFVPEILLCADAMYAALEVLRPHVTAESLPHQGKVVIGVIEGDIHDIGKNIVRMMLEGAGLEVHDLGRDVPVARFADEAERLGADIIAMSTLMSTTMEGMRRVVQELERRGTRDRFQILIGGSPLSTSFAQSIGAEAYGRDAAEAVRIAREMLAQEARDVAS